MCRDLSHNSLAGTLPDWVCGLAIFNTSENDFLCPLPSCCSAYPCPFNVSGCCGTCSGKPSNNVTDMQFFWIYVALSVLVVFVVVLLGVVVYKQRKLKKTERLYAELPGGSYGTLTSSTGTLMNMAKPNDVFIADITMGETVGEGVGGEVKRGESSLIPDKTLCTDSVIINILTTLVL